MAQQPITERETVIQHSPFSINNIKNINRIIYKHIKINYASGTKQHPKQHSSRVPQFDHSNTGFNKFPELSTPRNNSEDAPCLVKQSAN